MRDYKVIFMGTPIFAIGVLKALVKLFPIIKIIGIITQPDKKIGRKKIIKFSPVKEFALANNIFIFQPEKINDFYRKLKTLKLDVIITCAYGQFISERILKLAKINCINVHPSLLPKLRGGAPINKAIIYGEKITGVTLAKIVKQMDAGEIYFQKSILIKSSETASSLHDRLMILAEKIVKKNLLDILTKKINGIPQNNSEATFAYNITRGEEKINWFLSKKKIVNQIRGLYSYPIAYTTINNICYKIHHAQTKKKMLVKKDYDFVNGTIINITKLGIEVKVKDGYLLIDSLQREGKKIIDIKNYFYNISSEIFVGNVFI